ncbi:MAG: hypothetical protein AB7P31_00845 [Steroidobacteraceae bacterium]
MTAGIEDRRKKLFTVPRPLLTEANKLIRSAARFSSEDINGCRLTRDEFITRWLRADMTILLGMSPNSEPASRVLRKNLVDRRAGEKNSDRYAQLNVKLPSDVADQLDEQSTRLGIPRDLIMETLLERIVNRLHSARDILDGGGGDDSGVLYSSLLVSEADAEDQLNGSPAIDAIAQIENIPYTRAFEEYWRLSPKRRAEIRARPDVIRKINEFEANAPAYEEALAKLLDEPRRRRHPGGRHG